MGEFYLALYMPRQAIGSWIKNRNIFAACTFDIILQAIVRSIVLDDPLIWCWIDVVGGDSAFGEVDGEVFAVSADNLLNDSENSVVELQNHELNEQLMLISQLDEDEKNALVKIINSMLTKKRMKDLLDGKVNF